ncbi:hypothetical protein DVA67_008950 [Solirubrobacter sp. CPCC 204708]|uniref:Uncharacterized protein n=1 Tax=Solirubrobacter deserti TaxID=2282478 RepID=A0ABT4REA4_9ACTN|nr:hypothetical protein [Solirubrobacter deserti]MBE2316102.1 hypothetical protein [Solirubrobacter deserti]MDA0136852.1 hypothetical protein [Solirubrobacter deserti]
MAFVAPVSASAAEVPPLTVTGVRPGCEAPTGFPGEIVVTTGSANREAVQLVSATQTRLQRGHTIQFDHPVAGCAVAASQPNGAAVLAVPGDSGTLAYLRAPGGTWGEPTRFPGGGYLQSGRAAVAVSEAGDALVVWEQGGEGRRDVLYAARRLAGGAFGTPVRLADRPDEPARASGETGWFAAGIANGGEAVVAWSGLPPERPPHRTDVKVAIAPATGAFGTPVTVGEQTGYSTGALAMTPDGRALLALADPRRVRVLERTAGTPFGVPATVANVNDPLGTRAATALGPDGQAMIAWSGTGLGGVSAAIRRGGGAFSSELPAASADRRLEYDVWTAVVGATQPLPADTWGFGGARVNASIAHGIALLGWSGPRGHTRAANLLTFPLGPGTGVRQTVGGELSDAWDAFPVPLADGKVALAWIDAPDMRNAHRLRLLTDAPADTTPIPDVRVTPPPSRVTGDLVLPFRCSGPCEIRAQVINRHAYEDSARLTSARSGRLRLRDFVAPRRVGPVRVRFTVGALDGRRSRTWTTTYRLHGRRQYRLLRVDAVRAERRGSRIRVTVRSEFKLPDGAFFAVGGFDRRGNVEPLTMTSSLIGSSGRRQFTVSLPAQGVRWVATLLGEERRFVRVR